MTVGAWAVHGDPHAPQGKLLWLDVTAGAAGDMLCAALIDAGASIHYMQECVDAVLTDAITLSTEEVDRRGLRARLMKAELKGSAPKEPVTHQQIAERIAAAQLPEDVAGRALAVFASLAVAEGQVHGVDPRDVHFHEVGNWDSIADVVSFCAGLSDLDIDLVSASPMALGHGRTETAHGALPIPAPAVLELVARHRWEVLGSGPGERATPTGAALVTTLSDACGFLPEMRVERVGVGAGTRDDAETSNIARAVIGSIELDAADVNDPPWLVEANIDDMDPRILPGVIDRLLAVGAYDAWLVPIHMKKGRPGFTLSALVSESLLDVTSDVFFAETSTIGLRQHPTIKLALQRDVVTVNVLGSDIRIKVATHSGTITTANPEFSDVAQLAAERGAPLKCILETATHRARMAGLFPGADFPPKGITVPCSI